MLLVLPVPGPEKSWSILARWLVRLTMQQSATSGFSNHDME
jgi:hypothetical protein